MTDRKDWVKKIKKLIPKEAELIETGCPFIKSLVQVDYFDKEGVPEAAAIYQWKGNRYLIVLRKSEGKWLRAFNYFIGASFEGNGCRGPKQLYPASVNTVKGAKWGYIDSNGKFIISPSFDSGEDFQDNGLAVVGVSGKSGIINEKGEFIVPPKYDYINSFSEGIAAGFVKGVAEVINEKGQIVLQGRYAGTFQEGRGSFVPKESQEPWIYGYFDKSGEIAITPRFLSAGNFKDKKAVVKLSENSHGIIDENGNILSKLNYAVVGELGEGLLSFAASYGGKYGYTNEMGKVVIPPKFTMADKFLNGRAVVNAASDYSNKYGLIDSKGNYTAAPIYNSILMLGEGRAAYGKSINANSNFMNSIYAIGDLNGKLFTDFIYYDVTPYENGLASANDDRYTFFIDKTGKKGVGLISVKGIGTLKIINNIIQAQVDFRRSYYTSAGKLLYAANKNIPLSSKYYVLEEKYRPNRNYIAYYPQVKGIDNPVSEMEINKRLKYMSQAKGISPDAELDYSYSGDFTIKLFNKELLVLEMSAYNYPFGAAHGMPILKYAHVDMKKGVFYELKDLFKKNSNYVEVLSEIIKKQIELQGDDSMVWPDAYKGIKADQPFYVTENNLYIYFTPYEIAPYAAGFPIFTIPFKDIIGVIDSNGGFWNSFH